MAKDGVSIAQETGASTFLFPTDIISLKILTELENMASLSKMGALPHCHQQLL